MKFNKYMARRNELEDAFWEPLTWERMEAMKASRIGNAVPQAGK